LPSFLNQANKAKQSEAKQYLASINKGQQAYYAEESSFVEEIKEVAKLGLGIKTATNNYTYNIETNGSANGGANAWTATAASGLNFYAGLVYLTDASGALTSQTAICESDVASTDAANTKAGPGGLTDCGGDFPDSL